MTVDTVGLVGRRGESGTRRGGTLIMEGRQMIVLDGEDGGVNYAVGDRRSIA